ncbi:MAG: DUF885 domain-containing protein [Cyclobacteriaceae bacterium]|jgi:uncharacterized protein (DUF885 family)|nr:hypothetical protein [Cytophagales bacterium]HNP77611.1 DUF885 domain-containing protein [Cyclobacteriaceae bacterium]
MNNLRYLLLTLVLVASCSGPQSGSDASGQLRDFLVQFSAEEEEEAGDRTLSEAYFSEQLSRTTSLLKRLEAIPKEQLKGDDLVDWKFAHSILRGRELRQGSMKPWTKNPRLFMVFTQISGLIERPGKLDAKLNEVEKRLRLVPEQLSNGQKLLNTYIPRFQELSLFMAENGKVLFDRDLPAFIAQAGSRADTLTQLTQAAGKSLDEFITYLKNDLPRLPQGEFGIGKAAYEEMLRDEYLITYGSDSLYRFGWSQFNKTVKELEALAKTIDPKKTWQELARDIKNDYPSPDSMIQAHQYWVDKSREHIVGKNLIPIPWPERVRVVPRAEYLRKTSYYGNFSIARGKDKDSIFTSEWMINPFEHQWPEQRKQEYLVEHDYGVIIVTAPHETYGGHHVQGLYQMHNERPFRKNHGISIFSEGWGLYNEQLMQETGFFPTERIHLRQLQLRLWRNARVIYDVGMHTGQLSYEDAIKLMTDQVGFLRWAAQLEVDSSSASPGYFIGYFMGMTEILAMREDYRKLMGPRFTLTDFHEKLLKIGNMPPALMREALFQSATR